MKIAVVIPYYQHAHGLLAAAVASIAGQRVAPDISVDVIVIDDGSPVSAAAESMPNLPAQYSLTIIARANGGVASARNAGLDAVACDADAVAFLDSDDRWAPDHLQRGIDMLRQGAWFYFDNGYDLNGQDRFARTPFMRDRHGYDVSAAPYSQLVDGAEFFAALVTECVPHTSQVIYDFRRLGRYRFDESLRTAGEDHLFWLTLTEKAPQVGYHSGLMGARGRGVSINSGAYAWDSREGLQRVVDEISLHSKIKRRFALTSAQQAAIDTKLMRDCDHFFFLMIRNCHRYPVTALRAFRRLSKLDAAIWRRAPASLMRLRAHRASFTAA